MMRRIEIELEGVVGVADLFEDLAPRAANALWESLPLETMMTHSKWSGRACGFTVTGLSAVPGLEHGVCSIYPGTLIARPDRGEVLLSYGAAEYRSALGVEYGTRIGRLVHNQSALLAVLSRMHDEGDKEIKIRRISDDELRGGAAR
jgi:uncharacterized protein DUF3830